MTKPILAVDPSWSIEELLARLRAAPPRDGQPRKTIREMAIEQGVGPYRASLDHISPDERTPEERRIEEEAWKAWQEDRRRGR
jgi:hypothetical protein